MVAHIHHRLITLLLFRRDFNAFRAFRLPGDDWLHRGFSGCRLLTDAFGSSHTRRALTGHHHRYRFLVCCLSLRRLVLSSLLHRCAAPLHPFYVNVLTCRFVSSHFQLSHVATQLDLQHSPAFPSTLRWGSSPLNAVFAFAPIELAASSL